MSMMIVVVPIAVTSKHTSRLSNKSVSQSSAEAFGIADWLTSRSVTNDWLTRLISCLSVVSKNRIMGSKVILFVV
jgi:hypothetical protein